MCSFCLPTNWILYLHSNDVKIFLTKKSSSKKQKFYQTHYMLIYTYLSSALSIPGFECSEMLLLLTTATTSLDLVS